MTNPFLADALDRYKREVSILKKGYQQECYRIDLIKRSELGQKVVRQITSVDIATYRDKRLKDLNPKTGKILSPATVRLEMSLLSNFFDIGRIEWGVCDDNPVKLVRKPKPPPGRDRRLTPREDRQILRYAHAFSNRELYSIIVVALETAMRQGEILGLTWENINLRSRVAHLPATKNGSKRDVPLSIRARDALVRLGTKSSGKVFRYSKDGIKSTWRFMVIKLGIADLHFHDMRHEACSRLFELSTLDVMEVAAISGHKSLSMLKRYTHLKAQRLVRKLEGNKSKGKQAVFDNLVPYPALVESHDQGYAVRLLDFEDLIGHGHDINTAMNSARDTLLRRILVSMRDDTVRIPQPDQFLQRVDEASVVMVDPLNVHEMV